MSPHVFVIMTDRWKHDLSYITTWCWMTNSQIPKMDKLKLSVCHCGLVAIFAVFVSASKHSRYWPTGGADRPFFSSIRHMKAKNIYWYSKKGNKCHKVLHLTGFCQSAQSRLLQNILCKQESDIFKYRLNKEIKVCIFTAIYQHQLY